MKRNGSTGDEKNDKRGRKMSGSDEGVNKEDIKAANDLVNEANGSPGVSQLLFPLHKPWVQV